MSLDSYVSEEYQDKLSLEDKRLIRKIKIQEPEPTRKPGVYVIYHAGTGEALYVGHTKALIRRISDHFRRSRGSQLLAYVEDDDEIDIERGTKKGRDGNVWEKTEVKSIEIESKERRKRIEDVLEDELSPRYSSG